MWWFLRLFRKKLKTSKPIAKTDVLDFIKSHECMYIAKDGLRLYPCMQTYVLYAHYALDLDRLLLLSAYYKEDFERVFMPMIRRFIQKVGILPASELNHDANAGGLIRHSLNVACNALKFLKAEGICKDENALYSYNAAVILLSLVHDLGKIITDYQILSPDEKYVFDGVSDNLQNFCARHNLEYLALRFNAGRHHQHEALLSLCINMLVDYQDEIVSIINRNLDFIKLQSEEHMLFDIIIKADAEAVKHYGSLGQNLLYVPDFIKSYIVQGLYKHTLCVNTIDSELFLCSFGLILQCGSQIFNQLKSYFEQVVLGRREDEFNKRSQNFTQRLRELGVFASFGTKRIYNFYRLQIGSDLIYVKGAQIALPELKGFGEYANAVMVGSRMVGLETALSDLKNIEIDKIVFVRVINGALLQQLRLENLDLNSIKSYDPKIPDASFFTEALKAEIKQVKQMQEREDKAQTVSQASLNPDFDEALFKCELDEDDEILQVKIHYPKCLIEAQKKPSKNLKGA